jgi:hypothetical protein
MRLRIATSSSRFRIILLCSLSLVLLISGAVAQDRNLIRKTDFWSKPGYFGLVMGFVGPSQLFTDTINYETESGFTMGFRFDFHLVNHTYWGVSADIHRLHVRDTGQYLFDLSFNLKQTFFSKGSRVAFRPGVGIGYGYLAQFREYNSAHFVLAKGGLEVLFFSSQAVAYTLEVSMLGSVWGSNQNMDLRLGPTLVGRAGLMF